MSAFFCLFGMLSIDFHRVWPHMVSALPEAGYLACVSFVNEQGNARYPLSMSELAGNPDLRDHLTTS